MDIENKKIELLCSANWSRLNWDRSWEPIIDLIDILPHVGEKYFIHLEDSEAEQTQNGTYFLLWLPPHSELNGLCDRPQEILNAHVIQAKITTGEWIKEEFYASERAFNTEIVSVKKLMDYVSSINITIDGSFHETFKKEDYFETYYFVFDQYLYLKLYDQYLHYEFVFQIEPENYNLIFFQHFTSGYFDCAITKIRLSPQQINWLKHLLNSSVLLKPIKNSDILTNQVHGADYY